MAIKPLIPTSITPEQAAAKMCVQRIPGAPTVYNSADGVCVGPACMAWIEDSEDPGKGWCAIVLDAVSGFAQ